MMCPRNRKFRGFSHAFVGADAHIGPVPAYLHTKRADVGIGPYTQKPTSSLIGKIFTLISTRPKPFDLLPRL